MITVKFLGGARKYSHNDVEIIRDSLTVADLLIYLQKVSPKNQLPFEEVNVLIAVNGIDSSAIQGKETLLKDGDVVSIIPIVHGGNVQRTQFIVSGNNVEIVRLKSIITEPIKFLELLRIQYPDLIIQGIQTRYILNPTHARKIIAISIAAQTSNTLLSNRIETDILMRFACSRQIDDAISKVGMKNLIDSLIIIIGEKLSISQLFNEIKHNLRRYTFSKNNIKFIKKDFAITDKILERIVSETPLEDFLAERSAILFH